MRVIGSLWVWAGFFVVVAVTDVALLTATGNGDSGQQDGFGQVFGFLLFLVCGFLVVALCHGGCAYLAQASHRLIRATSSVCAYARELRGSTDDI